MRISGLIATQYDVLGDSGIPISRNKSDGGRIVTYRTGKGGIVTETIEPNGTATLDFNEDSLSFCYTPKRPHNTRANFSFTDV